MKPRTLLFGVVIVCGVLSIGLLSSLALALDVPAPPSDIPVVDQTDTLSDEQKNNLAEVIARERQETGNQIAVLMVGDLGGRSIEEYSLQVARQWGVGQAERDSGVLLLIAKNDRRLRIETGRGLEGALTDATAGRIIRDRITPEFRRDNYYQGIKSGLDGIVLAIHDEADPELGSEVGVLSGAPWEFIFFLVFFGPIWLGSILARTKSWWAGGVIGGIIGVILGWIFGFMFTGIVSIVVLGIVGLLFDKAVSKNYQQHKKLGDSPSWWAGGPYIGGGRGSGGGFGGFGGGGFGGGGSSGSW